jgi:hypothetical protein
MRDPTEVRTVLWRRVLGAEAAVALIVLLGLVGWPGAAPAQPSAVDRAPDVTLADFAWMAGTWRGPGPDGSTAEIHFMRPRAGGLPSVFRLWKGDRVLVLEMISLVREDGGLVMYVRHFDPALVPWEKEDAIGLRLVKREGDAFHFRNVVEGRNPRTTEMRRTDGGFVSRSVLSDPDGSTREIRVEYTRVEE